MGLITRNIAHEPQVTLAKLFRRHAIDLDALDFFIHVPLKKTKLDYFRAIRNSLAINPARAYACGDEYQDYAVALARGSRLQHCAWVILGVDGI